MNNDITYTTMNKHLVVDKEWVKKRIEENGLIMIESTFTMLNNGFFAFTSEGYIVKVTSNSIYKNQSNPIFSTLNPYTTYNINRYIYCITWNEKRNCCYYFWTCYRLCFVVFSWLYWWKN